MFLKWSVHCSFYDHWAISVKQDYTSFLEAREYAGIFLIFLSFLLFVLIASVFLILWDDSLLAGTMGVLV